MNKILNIFTAVCLLLAAGCARDMEAVSPGESYGMLDLEAVSYAFVSTRAVDVSDYSVKIWRIRNLGEELVSGLPSTLAGFSEPIVLPVARYRLEVATTARPAAAAFDSPWYVGGTEFSIARDETTTPAPVECTLQNARVTVRYGESLQDAFFEGADVKTVVTVGDNSLEFPDGEIRSGYFAVDGTAGMHVVFTGKVGGNATTIERTYDVAPGQWLRLRFVLEDDSSFPIIVLDEGDNGAGQIGDGTPWI